MKIQLGGLCKVCANEKCRLWLIKNLDGIEGKLIVEKCEFHTPTEERQFADENS